MTFVAGLLLVLLLLGVAFAAFQYSEAQRWRSVAADSGRQAEQRAAELDQSRRNLLEAEVRARVLLQSQQQLEEKFRLLASEALQNNSQLFLDRSRDQLQHLVDPVNQTLKRFEEHVKEIEKTRVGAYSEISAQVKVLTELQERVRQSTDQLKTALRSPVQRGRWGEMQLRRVVELAGMLEYSDFAEQKTLFGEQNQRPDLIVRLPNNCQIVVDSKVSLEAYLRAMEAEQEPERLRHLKDHANQVRTHVKALGEKAYWQRLPTSPEFVIAFLPLESLYSAAIEQDPSLMDFGVERRVLIATPGTLITLLLTISHGWRQQAIAENLDQIRTTGQELYTRLLTMAQHFSKLGNAIERTVETYNQTVGSLERNVLTSARKFSDLRPANAGQLEETPEVENMPRRLDASKWRLLEGNSPRDNDLAVGE
jgi:DNA recombination protein RmuC